jgi:hypothetical protein
MTDGLNAGCRSTTLYWTAAIAAFLSEAVWNKISSDFGHDRRGRTDMKALFLVAVAALAILATTAPSVADDNGRACSTASLKGRYGLAQHGVRLGIHDSMGIVHFLDTPVRVDGILDETFDGHGNATETEKVFANGSAVPGGVNPTTTNGFITGGVGEYQVSDDCTGLEDLTYPDGSVFHRAFVLSDGGKTIHILAIGHHFPQLPAQALPPGVTCAAPTGCDAAEQIYTDGERY